MTSSWVSVSGLPLHKFVTKLLGTAVVAALASLLTWHDLVTSVRCLQEIQLDSISSRNVRMS